MKAAVAGKAAGTVLAVVGAARREEGLVAGIGTEEVELVEDVAATVVHARTWSLAIRNTRS